MSYQERKILIEKLEVKRKSKIITLIISDRSSTSTIQGINAQIAPDQVSKIIEHIKLFVEKEYPLDRIELLIYSRGGDVNTPWPLVSTIRNYTKEFNVIIPLHAHSSATLISLGANEIIMTKTASISPVDPTVANAFNPKENNASLGISVEDVTSFFKLAKDTDRAGITGENNLTEVFKTLVDKVHPLALGNVKRSHTQIRLLSSKLLQLHLVGEERKKIEGIIDELTEKLYTHYHLINREEGRAFGLENIKDADEIEEKLLWEVYSDYESELKLKDIFDVNVFLGNDDSKEFESTTIFIESTEKSSSFKVKQLIKRTLLQDPGHRLQVINSMKQYSINSSNLKSQLIQLKTNATQLNAQVTNLLGTNPNLNQVLPVLNNINGQIDGLISSISDDLDITDLKIVVETIVKRIGWE